MNVQNWVKKVVKNKMVYSKDHKESECDKCLKDVGKDNLFPLPFTYKDYNDYMHKDEGCGYRQYYCCKKCYDWQMEHWNAR